MNIKTVAAFCRKWDMLPAGGLVLCAVSGGRDSMALLHVLWELSQKENFRVAAAHFNHQLRPTADRDEALVHRWCKRRDIPMTSGLGNVKAHARKLGTGLEDAARDLRYIFLEDAADRMGAKRIATAHHLEDNAETVLLHLLRGTGLQGLGGIPPVRGRIVRPLLEVRRAEIDAYVKSKALPYGEDETNADPAFTRNRLRLEALPLLEEIAPGCTVRIAGAAALLREEENRLQREAEVLLTHGGCGEEILPVPLLMGQDLAMRRRLVRTMGKRLGAELGRKQVDAVLALKSGRCLDLPGQLCAVQRAGRLILRRRGGAPPPLELRQGGQTWGPWRVQVRSGLAPERTGSRTVVLKSPEGPLTIAPWDGRGRLAVENGSRTIKRLFADRGIPVDRREDHPALYLAGEPVAVFGVATDWARQPRPGEPCLEISLRPLDGEERSK